MLLFTRTSNFKNGNHPRIQDSEFQDLDLDKQRTSKPTQIT